MPARVCVWPLYCKIRLNANANATTHACPPSHVHLTSAQPQVRPRTSIHRQYRKRTCPRNSTPHPLTQRQPLMYARMIPSTDTDTYTDTYTDMDTNTDMDMDTDMTSRSRIGPRICAHRSQGCPEAPTRGDDGICACAPMHARLQAYSQARMYACKHARYLEYVGPTLAHDPAPASTPTQIRAGERCA